MSGLDILIAIIVLIGLWRGFQAGLVKAALGLVGWFIALIAASRLADSFAPQMAGFVQSPVLQRALAFLLVVLIVIASMHLIAAVFSSALKALNLGFIDKIGGAVVGAGKNVLVVLVMLSVVAPLLIQMPIWQRSVLAPELMPFAPVAQTMTKEVLGVAWNKVNAP